MVDHSYCRTTAGPASPTSFPALLGPADETPAWMPAGVAGASPGGPVRGGRAGLGAASGARPRLAPTLTSMAGGPITTVAPSTTSTALTSLTTGLPPGEHGVVGYRIAVHGEVLNVLRWSTVAG